MSRSRVSIMFLAAALASAGLLAPRDARAQQLDFNQAEPTAAPKTFAVVALADYTRQLEDVDYLSALVGMPDAGQSLRAMVTQFAGPDLGGLDKSRPLGVLVQATGFNVSPLVCLPVSDVSQLLQATTASGFASEEVGDGVTKLSGPGMPVFLKPQGAWVYGAQTAEALSTLPSDPTSQFEELVADYDFAVRLMAQDAPPMLKQFALSQITGAMQQDMQQMPDETAEQFATRRQMAEASMKNVNMFFEGLNELNVGLAINPAGGGVNLDVRTTAIEGSQLASQLAAVQPAASRFSGFHDPGATLTFVSSGKVAEDALPRVVEDAQVQLTAARRMMDSALEEEGGFPNPEAKETVRSAVDDLFAAFEDMVKSGRTDAAGWVRLNPEAVTLVGAFATPTPEKVDAALRKLAALIEEDAEFPPVGWNAYEHAGVKFHTMEIPIPAFQTQPRKLFGDSLPIAVGVGEGAVYVAVGRDNLNAVSGAIDASQTGGAGAAHQFQGSVSLKGLADFAAAVAEGADGAPAMMLAQAIDAAPDPAKNRVSITAETTPDGVGYQIVLDEAVVSGAGKTLMQVFGQMLGPMMQ